MASDRIVVRGAREHNLKNIDLEIPRDQLVVITGLSGSGKSSLAFDTIYAEGQRRYVESLSAYARQFLEQMEKPEVDSIEGLSPAISIEQKTTSKNPRSTVGTVTEIYDYLRVLFARVGVPHCPSCGKVISAQTVQQMVDRVLLQPAGTRLLVLAPVVRGRKGEYKKLFFDLQRQGFSRVRVNGVVRELGEEIELDKKRKHTIDVVVDRLVVKDGLGARLADSLETALRLADGIVQVETVTAGDAADPAPMVFSERLACADCGISFPEVSPRMFSFNNPYGACPECGGIGTRFEIDPERLVPNANRSLKAGALAPWAGRENAYFKQTLAALAKTYRFSLDQPWAKLKKPVRDVILGGDRDGGFEGVVKLLERRYRETESEDARREIEAFMAERPCPVCEGSRLRRESLGLRIAGKSIADVVRPTIKDAPTFFNTLKLGEREAAIARRVLKEIRERLGFLANVGLDYLTLDRPAGTLSGGEGQRIRLATQIGSSLVGVLYILDEPSIGLHQRDNRRLLDTLRRLRDLGNTVLVVEHDEETIRNADYVVDLGPGAGELGGHVVAIGTPDEIMANPNSLTGRYLAGALEIPVPATRRKGSGHVITIHNPREHNLKGMPVRIPLGTFTSVTGVSGSGKSTLVNDILYRALAQMLHRAQDRPGAILGAVEHLGGRAVQDVVDQRRFARPRDAGDAREGPERDPHGHPFEVVLARVVDRDDVAAPLPPRRRHRDLESARQVAAGERVRVRHDLVRRPDRDDVAAQLAGTRAEVHHVVGVADRLLVVLDDEHRVAEIPEPLERLEQAPVVPLVQSDGRFVEDVEHADETRPDLCRQTNSLPLAAGERARGPVQGEIVEADVHEEAEARAC